MPGGVRRQFNNPAVRLPRDLPVGRLVARHGKLTLTRTLLPFPRIDCPLSQELNQNQGRVQVAGYGNPQIGAEVELSRGLTLCQLHIACLGTVNLKPVLFRLIFLRILFYSGQLPTLMFVRTSQTLLPA